MKILIQKYFIAFLIFLGCLSQGNGLFAQTATFGQLTGGLSGSTVTSGTAQVPVVGFSVAVTGGTITFNSFFFTSQNTINFITNGTLYRSPTSTFSSTSPGVPVGNVTFSGTNVTINNFTEAISGTNYYFLVGDAIATSTSFQQFVVSYGTNWATDINGNSYPPHFSGNYQYTFNSGTPYPLSVSNQNTGLATVGTTIAPGTSALKMYEISITNNSSSSYTISTFNITSNLGTALGSTFNNFKLYSNTSNAFPGGSPVPIATVASTSSAYVTFTTASETIASHTTKYYYLVADAYSGGTPATVQFQITDGQSGLTSPTNPSIISSSPGTTNFNTATAYGNSYSVNYANLTVTSLTGGTTSGTLTALQSGVVLFGFSVATSSGSISVSQFNINSSNTAQTYFDSGVLYRCNNTNYASATTKVAVGTVTFSGTYANVVFTSPESITTSSTNQNYFLVANNINAASPTATIAFNFANGQSTPAIVQTSPSSSYNIYSITGNTLTLPSPTILVNGANTYANGITQGTLTYGQNDIVLFGFSAKAFGASMDITKIDVHTSGSENNYFGNARIYRSATAVFPGGTPAYTSSVVAGCNCGYFTATVSETIPSGTTYYYWLVADYTGGSTGPTTFSTDFNLSQGGGRYSLISSAAGNLNYNVTGPTFNIALAENWVGTTSDFNLATNYKAINGGSGFIPTSATIINIGGAGKSFTNSPTLTASITVGGINFGTTGTPNLTIPAGMELKIATGINTSASSTPTITGPGTLTVQATALSNVALSSTLTLNGTLVASNAGTFTMASTSVLNLTGNSTLANTGTFTLASDANGSATIGALSGTSALTGPYIVQRYITGGSLLYRGYRLLTSPVHSGATGYYDMSFLSGSGSYLTGAANGGFDATGNPTIFLYREDMLPSTASFTAGNYRAITKINNAPAYNIGTIDGSFNLPVGAGFLFFYRGNNGTSTTTIPSNLSINISGTLNQGQIVVKNWVTGSSNLAYSTTSGSLSVEGFNLVGNPYPSSVNWRTAYNNASSTTGIYAPNTDQTYYIYNAVTKNYDSYLNTSATTGIGSTTAITNVIPSGQGFFVHAINGSAQLIFNESAKVNTQVTGNALLLNADASAPIDRHLRIQLAKDSINKDETVLLFSNSASNAYVQNEDALYLKGSGVVSLSNRSADNTPLAINQLPFPKQTQVIPLNMAVTSAGAYQLNLTEASNIPKKYDVWLMDAYIKDSLDIKNNPAYSFKTTSDAATSGASRFSIVIRQNPAYAEHLLSFTAAKNASDVKLAWTAENEETDTRFTIERSVDGGKTFKGLDSLTSTNAGSYNAMDQSPADGLNQYRLKQLDVAGGISYSDIINIMYSPIANNLADNIISIYPNPAKNTLNLNINAADAASYKITVVNSSGTVVRTATSSQPKWRDDISGLSPGTYFVQVVNAKSNIITGRSTFIKL